ncbi:S-adenosyl-L-methionine-dependent methyltransferase [Viridothelium virens]|uniref:S-adenosyl-L-methionine-dependent methyltransferase n=1 Tax=Viridothelium virens TaxID=1048519 RepID=A0A6A6GSA5_VIRVR|nr:S-adenosyl-L-methionine-dependent methyltransferase [Viridothelium virens]
MSISTSDTLGVIGASLRQGTAEDQRAREDSIREVRKLMLSLENEDNTLERVCFQLWEIAAIRIGIDLNIFEILQTATGPMKAEDVAKATNADPLLIERVLRILGAYGAIDEVDVNYWGANSISSTFAKRRNAACVKGVFDCMSPAWLVAPALLKENGYNNPTSSTRTALAKAHGFHNGATVFQVLASNPSFLPAMSAAMSTVYKGRDHWMDVYPAQQRLIDGLRTGKEDTLMVDVGGGHGDQARKFRRRFLEAHGRFIVEDLPHGFPKEKPEGIEFLEHDIITAQPIHGARFYFLRDVAHDWSQEINTKILSHLRDAMAPGYSYLLINEWIFPPKGSTMTQASQDMNLMSINGGMERTEELHRQYIEAAGLEITGIWHAADRLSQSIIEAQVPSVVGSGP